MWGRHTEPRDKAIKMDTGQVGGWIKAHPYATGGIVFVGGLGLLYLLGYIGGGSAVAADAGTANLASAFYGAEAAQAQAGAAVQIQTLQSQADTNQAKINADAATAINASNNGMAMTINGQNTSAAVAGQLSSDFTTRYVNESNDYTTQFVTQSNNSTALQEATNNLYAQQYANDQNNQANLMQTILGTIIPQELVLGKGTANLAVSGVGSVNVNAAPAAPAQLAAAGMTPAQIQAIWG